MVSGGEGGGGEGMVSKIVDLKGGHQPILKRIAYPSDYGLANAAYSLLRDYGKDGAINRLIEMAERIDRDESVFDVLRCKRVVRQS